MRTQLSTDEKLIIQVNKHWITLTKPLFFVLLSFIILVATFKYQSLASFRDVAFWGVVLAPLYFIYKFYERKFDIWAVTNMRVVDESGVFTRNTKDSPLDRINNVTYEQSFVGLFLGFGDVKIQTAAEEGDTAISFVMHPKELKDAIIEAQKKFREVSKQKDVQPSDPPDGMIECPWCAELIKKKALICRFCRREIHPKDQENNSVQPTADSRDREEPVSQIATGRLKGLGKLLYPSEE
ncbi:MAG: PH domain-containing protein [Deltaproteobacteria bacterium]|nr:PH domain-containing protein [Deltaproteobacteria bacterium]